ncbi:hypothetical protein KIL84_018250, partial [Mauremys mutica]
GQVSAKKELGGSNFSKAQDYAMKKNILEAKERGQNTLVRRYQPCENILSVPEGEHIAGGGNLSTNCYELKVVSVPLDGPEHHTQKHELSYHKPVYGAIRLAPRGNVDIERLSDLPKERTEARDRRTLDLRLLDQDWHSWRQEEHRAFVDDWTQEPQQLELDKT